MAAAEGEPGEQGAGSSRGSSGSGSGSLGHNANSSSGPPSADRLQQLDAWLKGLEALDLASMEPLEPQPGLAVFEDRRDEPAPGEDVIGDEHGPLSRTWYHFPVEWVPPCHHEWVVYPVEKK